MPKAQRQVKQDRDQKVTGPRGEVRPADDFANAVRVMEIATGLAEEEYAPGHPRPEKKPQGAYSLNFQAAES